MLIRSFAIILLICCACQGGKIPCPRIKTVKLHKNFKPSASALSAKANQHEEAEVSRTRDVKTDDVRFIKNISVEEWDCPKPGSKHYMPKSVKENIKRNKKKIESDFKKENQPDSLSTQ